MSAKPKKESILVNDDTAEVSESLDRKLIQGPVEELVEFFGLGDRVTSALRELGCQNGLDLLKVNPDKAFLLAGEKTARRICLLFEFLRLKKSQKKNGIAGPSQKT